MKFYKHVRFVRETRAIFTILKFLRLHLVLKFGYVAAHDINCIKYNTQPYKCQTEAVLIS